MDGMRRERMDMDVVVVGAGPAGLSFALHLARLMKTGGSGGQGAAPGNVCVLEKAEALGMHTLSGAVMDPRALVELLPRMPAGDVPQGTPVSAERLLFLGERRAWRSPYLPAPLRNHGHRVVSLGSLVQWLGAQAQLAGVDVFTGFAGAELLVEGERVVGVRTDDKGVDRDGRAGSNFQAGLELRARLTVLAEGAHGSLTKALIRRFGLDRGRNPRNYALGVKEVWEVPAPGLAPGEVWHTLGYPLDSRHQGGGWLYGMPGRRVSLGLLSTLAGRDPAFDPHAALQAFKRHPVIRRQLAGGKLLHYGAKTVPVGGYWAMPEPYADGAMLIGDAAGLFDTRRLKGIHLAIKSGMLAAETAFEALQAGDCGRESLASYPRRLERSWVRDELWRSRNHYQGFDRGLWQGLWHAALQGISGGRGLHRRYPARPGHARMMSLETAPEASAAGTLPAAAGDEAVTFDRAASVYHSGVRHREDQPSHLIITEPDICAGRCAREFGNPCRHFCPAGVYELVGPERRLKVNAQNCLHCKACDIMDPYQIIDWTTPEGGGGPRYDGM
jgi:electron-transferring-flavoprotein dehydrogenase